VALRSALGWQRHHSFSCRLLAGVPDGVNAAGAETSLGSRLVPDGREQDEQVQRQRGAARPIANMLGTDAMRYFLLREVVFGQDGNFSYDALVTR